MSDFHLKAELSPDSTVREVTEIRAQAFQTALNHAATDPLITIQMLVASAGSEYESLVARLANKIWKCGPEIVALTRRWAADPTLPGPRFSPQLQILAQAVVPHLDDLERIAEKQGRLPG